ncbi:hypothetical protein FACS189418_5290 [Clostridia bacterium]|nr:hypothetical protein FACS189418_5290 [Clostridia bacterium]
MTNQKDSRKQNGLFLLSIGLLIFLIRNNAITGKYDLASTATALFFIILGLILYFSRKK